MKVMWFTNIPLPRMLDKKNCDHAASGNWMMALLERLDTIPDLEISVVCASPRLTKHEIRVSDKLRYYPIPQGAFRRLFGFKSLDNDPRYLNVCKQIVLKVQPDIIHIHGTERFYGLLSSRHLVTSPVIISLQGLLHEYARYRNYFGFTPFKDIIATQNLVHLIRGMGPFFEYFHLRQAAQREEEIIRGNQWFMGRTDWDHAHLVAINPRARYFYSPEIMRPTFYNTKWDLNSCERYRIIFTNANSFRRGIETLFDALVILSQNFPKVRLALAGGVEQSPYGKVLLKRMENLDITDKVDFLGNLNEKQMNIALSKAHIFAITSFIENSPNSLCEAQMVGLPCVVSYTGGTPSLVEESRTGLFFPSGDAPVLAERIRQIFINDDLARSLGAQARQVALVRHDPDTIVNQVLETYRTVIRAARSKESISLGKPESPL